MDKLDVRQPFCQDEELSKAILKEGFFKRVEIVKNLIANNKEQINLIGFMTAEKKNTLIIFATMINCYELLDLFLTTVGDEALTVV